MKKLILYLLFASVFPVQAEMKEVFKRIPKKYDVIIKLDVQKVMDFPLFKKIIADKDEFKEFQELSRVVGKSTCSLLD